MPIVGSFAGASARAYGLGAGAPAVGDFESISTTTVSSPVSSVTFSSIPQTYTHLQIRAFCANTTGFDAYALVTLNSTASYTHYLLGINNAPFAGSNTSSIFGPVGYGSSGSLLNRFGSNIIDILDYTNTNKFKTVRTFGGVEGNALGSLVSLNSGYAATTSAITTITITSQGTNFAQYSSFALYGIV